MVRVAIAGAALAVMIGGLHLTASSSASASACTPQVQEDGSMLYAQVYDAKPIKKSPERVKAILPKWVAGAKMYIYAQKGMTSEYLNRAAICHAKASKTSSYANDPLRVDGKIDDIRVYSAGGAFVISVTSENKATGREIWERADALTREVDSDLVEKQRAADADM